MTTGDIITRTDCDLQIAEAHAVTERGEEFIDAYTALDLDAIDAGRISIPLDGLYAFRVRAREAGLTVRDGGVIT